MEMLQELQQQVAQKEARLKDITESYEKQQEEINRAKSRNPFVVAATRDTDVTTVQVTQQASETHIDQRAASKTNER